MASYSAALNSLTIVWIIFPRFVVWILSSRCSSRLCSPFFTSSFDSCRSLVVGMVDNQADADFSALTEIRSAAGRYTRVSRSLDACRQ